MSSLNGVAAPSAGRSGVMAARESPRRRESQDSVGVVPSAPQRDDSVSSAKASGEDSEKSYSAGAIQDAVEKLNTVDVVRKNKLSFTVDDTTGRVVVRVNNSETGETVRQIPADRVLKMAAALRDFHGRIVDEQR